MYVGTISFLVDVIVFIDEPEIAVLNCIYVVQSVFGINECFKIYATKTPENVNDLPKTWKTRKLKMVRFLTANVKAESEETFWLRLFFNMLPTLAERQLLPTLDISIPYKIAVNC